MALDPVVNFFRSTIATLPVASGGTSIVITTGDGAKLPDPAVDGNFNLTIYNEDDPFDAPEIVRVTAIAGDTLTVTRAQEGTSATNKTSGNTWYLELTPTAKTIQDIDTAKLDVADVVNNLTSTDTDKALSANQGKVLQDGKLNLSGGTMTGDLTIPDKIIHSGDTNTAIRFPSADTVTIETNGVERMRVDSSGNVGVGTNAPATRFTVVDGLILNNNSTENSFNTTKLDSNGNAWSTRISQASLILNGEAAHRPEIDWYRGGRTNPEFVIRQHPSQDIGGQILAGDGQSSPNLALSIERNLLTFGTNNTERMRITSAGNVGIGTTSPATALDVNGAIRTSTGILFGADTAAANTLDDYEEGTWTPTLIAGIFGTTDFTSVTYNAVRGGNYIKTGRLVIATFRMRTDAITVGSADGAVAIGGLPFTVVDNNFRGGSGSVSESNSFAANKNPQSVLPDPNTTVARLMLTPITGTLGIIPSDVATGNNSNVVIGVAIYISV